MKLLRVKANHFKNCCDGYTIDLVAKSRKTAEDMNCRKLRQVCSRLVQWLLLEKTHLARLLL